MCCGAVIEVQLGYTAAYYVPGIGWEFLARDQSIWWIQGIIKHAHYHCQLPNRTTNNHHTSWTKGGRLAQIPTLLVKWTRHTIFWMWPGHHVWFIDPRFSKDIWYAFVENVHSPHNIYVAHPTRMKKAKSMPGSLVLPRFLDYINSQILSPIVQYRRLFFQSDIQSYFKSTNS